MKKVHLLVLLLVLCSFLKAQEAQQLSHSRESNKLLQLNAGLGTGIDLMHRGAGNAFASMAAKKSPFPVVDFRLEHFFSRKWGWFANIKIGIPSKFRTDYYSELARVLEKDYYIRNHIFEKQKPPVTPCLAVGLVHRIENSHWAFYPRLGIGVNSPGFQDVSIGLKKKGGNQIYETRYDIQDEFGQDSRDVFILSTGFSVNYKLSTYCYLFLSVDYIQPIGSHSTMESVTTDLYTDEVVDRQIYKTSTLGRDLSVSVGVGIPIRLGRKDKKGKTTSRKERMRNIMEQKRKSFGLFPTTAK